MADILPGRRSPTTAAVRPLFPPRRADKLPLVRPSARPRQRWLVSPTFDLGWFVLPGLLAAIVGLVIGVADAGGDEDSLTLWIAGVLLVDVAHVWASLYRTWLDPEARRRHASLLRGAPLLVFTIGFMAHAISPALFWTCLAYLAVFHFIKQQEGFVSIYLRAGASPPTRLDRALSKAAVWACTAGPVIYWHGHLPRRFAWFMADDFLTGLPAQLGTLAAWAQLPILALFFARRLQLGRRGHPMVAAIVAVTALCWNLGIVCFDDDRVFTITNVFLHGVPYMALVWIAGGRERVEALVHGARARAPARPARLDDQSRQRIVALLAVFYGLLAGLAIAEEALWDRLVWHDHPGLFGDGQLELDAFGLTLVVAALTLPQGTHYILDRYIWRVGEQNPRLAEQLGFKAPKGSGNADSIRP
ncbi:hypothetical protein G6O69_20360 [Pseudenhygromyxa sp. WMMC2535]|uniref:hypothetical protein n=1 Tax=Pseudenhygromyxa sp. WMMC2535 TaxID=2712867 RepID=UPI0015963928|nr:hypothetical protein [Pseudenhygromyxa sp. WMMC2535]NVB40207.1 hypothetical protein [Pseudenhygromyxa sp. WMMC2535]